jgi:excisionase family DNA binding protein
MTEAYLWPHLNTVAAKNTITEQAAPISVNIKGAASLIGCPLIQIRKGIYSGKLRAAKLGKSYYILVEDLEKWFESLLRTP